MKKVCQVLNIKPVKGDFGIEIEAEGRGMQAVANQFWNTEDDNSLRGHYPDSRAEFVLAKPIDKKDVKKALESLIASQEDARFDFSFRTSVHVHVNVGDLTENQVCNMIYTYLLLEEPLVNFCGRERKGNRFCLRVVDAEGMIDYLKQIFREGVRGVNNFNANDIRYSSLNVTALQKYGSLEFRAMRGNLDLDVLIPWTSALYNLREYACKMDTPKDILKDFQENEPKAFMQKVLGDVYEHFTYPRMVKEIQRSFSLTLDLPYAYKAQKAVEAPKYAEAAPAVAVRPRAPRVAVPRPVQLEDF